MTCRPSCVNCNGTGVTRGYGGGECPAIPRCPECLEPIEWDDNWEGRVPRGWMCTECRIEDDSPTMPYGAQP